MDPRTAIGLGVWEGAETSALYGCASDTAPLRMINRSSSDVACGPRGLVLSSSMKLKDMIEVKLHSPAREWNLTRSSSNTAWLPL